MKKYKYEESFTYEGRRYRVRADSKEELAVKKYKKRQELESGAKKIEKACCFGIGQKSGWKPTKDLR